ncbi:hypothetical protein VUR80DRAFT_9317 [Thermomyces stellatus]
MPRVGRWSVNRAELRRAARSLEHDDAGPTLHAFCIAPDERRPPLVSLARQGRGTRAAPVFCAARWGLFCCPYIIVIFPPFRRGFTSIIRMSASPFFSPLPPKKVWFGAARFSFLGGPPRPGSQERWGERMGTKTKCNVGDRQLAGACGQRGLPGMFHASAARNHWPERLAHSLQRRDSLAGISAPPHDRGGKQSGCACFHVRGWRTRRLRSPSRRASPCQRYYPPGHNCTGLPQPRCSLTFLIGQPLASETHARRPDSLGAMQAALHLSPVRVALARTHTHTPPHPRERKRIGLIRCSEKKTLFSLCLCLCMISSPCTISTHPTDLFPFAWPRRNRAAPVENMRPSRRGWEIRSNKEPRSQGWAKNGGDGGRGPLFQGRA